MQIDLKFGLEDMIKYFERGTASELYRNFYRWGHGNLDYKQVLDKYPDDGVELRGSIGALHWLIEGAFMSLYSKKKKLPDSSVPPNWFCISYFKMVGSPQYDEFMNRIRQEIGLSAEPFIEEYTLLALYRRSLDHLLMIIYATSTKECPQDIKEPIHNDKFLPSASQLNRFIEWLERHPEHNKLSLTNSVRMQLQRLFAGIQELHSFYQQNREGPLEKSGNEERNIVFENLNKIFAPAN